MKQHRFGSTQREVAAIGQGTWYIDNGDRASAIRTRSRHDPHRHGGDVRQRRGGGRRGDRVFLVSKVLPGNASRRGTIIACEKSLARLHTDRLDSYLLHWRGQHPLEETIAAFEQLQHEGKILCWGMSNFDVPDLEAVQKIAGEGSLVCNQVLYHLRQRAIKHAVIPIYCTLSA